MTRRKKKGAALDRSFAIRSSILEPSRRGIEQQAGGPIAGRSLWETRERPMKAIYLMPMGYRQSLIKLPKFQNHPRQQKAKTSWRMETHRSLTATGILQNGGTSDTRNCPLDRVRCGVVEGDRAGVTKRQEGDSVTIPSRRSRGQKKVLAPGAGRSIRRTEVNRRQRRLAVEHQPTTAVFSWMGGIRKAERRIGSYSMTRVLRSPELIAVAKSLDST